MDAAIIYVTCQGGTRAIHVEPGPTLRLLWQGPPDANGSPVVGGGTVWVPAVDTGVLYALNPLNGSVQQSLLVGHLRHFTTPTIVGGTVIVATDTTIQAFRHS